MAKPTSSPRFRFSLLALFGFVTFASVGCAAMANPNETSAIAIVTSVFAILAFAVLASIYAQREHRAFWLGFTILGVSYVVVSFVLTLNDRHNRSDWDITPYFATTRLLERFCNSRFPQPYVTATGTVWDGSEQWWQAYLIGQSLWTSLIAFVGGLVGRHLYLRREREKAVPKN